EHDTGGSLGGCGDVGMILISQALAEQIRPAVAAHARALPAVLEIPSKDHPYDPARDSVLRRARGLFAPDELR
uniref:ATPase H+ transporting V1 subunit F n=1 Tax=Ficedula albicollis TaxID=59894 RepID=A0A803W027_FICAL